MNEWYLDDPNVLYIFHKNINTLKKILWKNKNRLSSRKIIKIFSKEIQEEMNNTDSLIGDLSNKSPELKEFFGKLFRNGIFAEQMKISCDFIRTYPTIYQTYSSQILSIIPKNILNYINTLGYERCKALGYQEANLIKELKNKELLRSVDLGKIFIVGHNYKCSDIKKTLQQIYFDNGITKTAKASDLEEWFEVKYVNIAVSGKSNRGFKIIKLK